MTIQIESTDPAALAADSSVIYETTAAGAGQPDTGVRTVSAAESANSAPSNEGKDNGAVATSMIVLAIAGGAVLIGGGIIASNKKRNK
jgi:LPXTG-motif cell wall-anchored protein